MRTLLRTCWTIIFLHVTLSVSRDQSKITLYYINCCIKSHLKIIVRNMYVSEEGRSLATRECLRYDMVVVVVGGMPV